MGWFEVWRQWFWVVWFLMLILMWILEVNLFGKVGDDLKILGLTVEMLRGTLVLRLVLWRREH